MKTQKQAVVDEVAAILGSRFLKYQTVCLKELSSQELERVKENITGLISNGLVDYSKHRANYAEVRTYARSMVMNHLKKGRELNGNTVNLGSISSVGHVAEQSKPTRSSNRLYPKGVDTSIMPDYMKEYAKKLV